jgi:hypothetical protein
MRSGKEHRQDSGDDHHRSLGADAGRQDAERGGQGIGRCHRRNPEHSAAEETDDIALQTLLCHLVDPSRVGIVSYDEKISPQIRDIA